MLVSKVAEYGRRLDQLPIGYKLSNAHWVLDLDDESFIRYNGPMVAIPTSKRTSDICPHIFADNSKYTFGFGERGGKLNEAYLDLAENLGYDVDLLRDADFKARCYEDLVEGVAEDKVKEVLGRDVILVSRGGSFLYEEDVVKNYMSQFLTDGYLSGKDNICFSCGRVGPIMKLLPSKVFRYELSTFNVDAMASYGLSKNECAPICLECATHYCNGLRELSSSNNRIFYNDRVCLIWTDEDINILDILSHPDEDKLSALEAKKSLNAVSSGAIPKQTSFRGVNIALIKTASQGRASLISFEQRDIEEIADNILNYFSLHDEPTPIKGYRNSEGKYRRGMLDIMRNVKGGEKISHTYVSILDFALYGKRLPSKYLSALIDKCRKPKNKGKRYVSRDEAMLFRMFMEDKLVDESAFNLGKYLSIVRDIQRSALGEVNNDLVDKYFSLCLASPKSAFVKLNESSRKHLSKLRKDPRKISHYVSASRVVSEACVGLNLPSVFSTDQKASFCLGFHSQEQEKWERIRKAQEKKNESK